jgi:Putative DNA-binding domain
MSLLAIQDALQDQILGLGGDIAAHLAAPRGVDAAARLHVYHHAYRARLGDLLREAFDKTWSWLGDEAFGDTVTAYVESRPSTAFSLDDYGAGFPDFLARRLPDETEAIELAWLERAMRKAFDGADAAPLDPARLADMDAEAWDRARFDFYPTLSVRPVLTHLGALWAGIESGEAFTLPPVEPGLSVRVWRKGLQPHFRMIDAVEALALTQLMQGLPFADLCASMTPGHDADPVERAGVMLAAWMQDELIVGVQT